MNNQQSILKYVGTTPTDHTSLFIVVAGTTRRMILLKLEDAIVKNLKVHGAYSTISRKKICEVEHAHEIISMIEV
jgi:hypothetical protein